MLTLMTQLIIEIDGDGIVIIIDGSGGGIVNDEQLTKLKAMKLIVSE